MKPLWVILFALSLSAPALHAQERGIYTRITQEVIHGDNLKKVYPIAKEANRLLQEMEKHMGTLKTKREQQLFTKAMERKLKEQYAPVLRRMTFSQGKLLIKLIDRETGQTSYALVKELRNGFSAFLWQGVGRLFGMNLKDTYDPTGDDEFIEILIRLYEAGYL